MNCLWVQRFKGLWKGRSTLTFIQPDTVWRVIFSPTFMNQRRVDEKEFIPEQEVREEQAEEKEIPKELVFDEANKK